MYAATLCSYMHAWPKILRAHPGIIITWNGYIHISYNLYIQDLRT